MSEENLPDVEEINGHAVGFSYLRFYRLHPEIGLPVTDQTGDVGGWQNFMNAKLTWTGEKVQVYWVSSSPAPDWMEGQETKEFEV